MPYTAATPQTPEFQSDGTYRVPVIFTGSGVPNVPKTFMINKQFTIAAYNAWAVGEMSTLNAIKTVVDTPMFAQKLPIDLTPVVVTVPPEKVVASDIASRQARVDQLEVGVARLAKSGVAPSATVLSNIAALKAAIVTDVNKANVVTQTAILEALK